jgi:DNA modification methylase
MSTPGSERAITPISGSASPSFELADVDAVAWLNALPAESADLAITDPPYESLEKHRAIGTTTRLKHSKSSSNDWFSIFPNARFPELFSAVYRVLKKNSHFYLFCDQETMFVAKPLAEAAGFRFWKPLVWDKCIGLRTPVWTDRGVIHAEDVKTGDRVATPDGRMVHVLATRKTSAPALSIRLSDGSELIASREHRFVRMNGQVVEASELRAGDILRTGVVATDDRETGLQPEDVIDEDARGLEFPDPRRCLFCARDFESVRAAAAHQARFCPEARSKADMADLLGISAKRLRRWMSSGRLPVGWAKTLGLAELSTGRCQAVLQNDTAMWFPESIPLDYEFGRLVGLFAAEGTRAENETTFALHRDEETLAAFIARFVRGLGMKASFRPKREGNGAVVFVPYKMMGRLMAAFVGGERAPTKFLKPLVYAAPPEFRQGLLAGLLDGDGNWSHDEQRETLNISSLDLAMFALRASRERGYQATLTRFENEHAGGYRVRFDPRTPIEPVCVKSVEAHGLGETELVDIAIDDPAQLYLLGDGVVTHNCSIGMGYHYRSRYEFVLFFEKGKRKLQDLGIADVIQSKRIAGGYPTEKPAAVSEVLVKQSSLPGEVVIDPFMGSGSVGVAALSQGRRFLGTDIAPAARELTRQRLAAFR